MAPNAKPSLLVVDDEPDLRELLGDVLGDMPVSLTLAGSGSEAVETARQCPPDLIVTDLYLGDCTGIDVIGKLRKKGREVPAVVITGHAHAHELTRASRVRPIELMTKPLDIDRLRRTIEEELLRADDRQQQIIRTRRLRRLAREANLERKEMHQQLETTCADLTDAYRSLSSQMALQRTVLNYQRDLLSAKSDDDVFRSLFRLFVRRSGPVHGVAMVCDGEAELQVSGRFGVPFPDGTKFCRSLVAPIVQTVLKDPQVSLIDAGDDAERFDEAIRPFLVGVSVLALPLLPSPGEMIGLVVLYRKGEQPFTDDDLEIAEMIGHPTAVCVRRND